MSAVKSRFERGPITYQAGAAIAGGQLVQPGTGGTAALVIPAAANSITRVGMATTDALPAGTANTGTTPEGFPILNVTLAQPDVAVARRGVFKLQASGTFAFGDQVKCGANGTVVKWVDGTDTPGMKVGQCVDTAGGVSGSGSFIDLSL